MPLYEYQCTKCKHRFEKIQQFSDREIRKCPECGGKVEKLLSTSAVQFKGTGWHVTDYPKSGSAAKSYSEESTKSESSATLVSSTADGASTSESKPESKTVSKESKKPEPARKSHKK